ncbi:hypothetical protein SVIOM342S_06159 [Streptomyces violaceorubidus]
MAEVERSWYRRVLVAEDAGPIYYSDEDPDLEFRLTGSDTFAEAHATWQAEIETARRNAAGVSLDASSRGKHRRTGERFSLRWIHTHMIEEYARHNGHADPSASAWTEPPATDVTSARPRDSVRGRI